MSQEVVYEVKKKQSYDEVVRFIDESCDRRESNGEVSDYYFQ